jgi:PAS domain S-box-containing protein
LPEAADLKAENARLSARVAELEAQLAAKPPIDRASLYRMVNNAPWAVLTANLADVVEYANPAFQRWLTVPAPFGVRRKAALVAALNTVLDDPIRAAAASGAEFETEASLRDAGGELREVRLTVMPRGRPRDGVTGVIVSLYDVTETQALDRSVRENEARLNNINAVTPSVLYIYDVDLGYPVWAAGRAGVILGISPDEIDAQAGALRGRLVHVDDRPVVFQRLTDLNRLPDGEVCEAEYRVYRADGSARWILDRAVVFERNAEGRVTKTLSAAIDIDERKRAEERRTTLINELNHRVKNTLAAVQSIARQTLRSDRPAEQAQELFTDRLVALSAAHDVLTRENWEGAGLREIVDRALEAFMAHGEGRIAIAGPEVRLGSRAALALAMALHELATNALKYGALSGEAGEVTLSWQARAEGAAARLELEWREHGGPPVARPARRGFGSRLLTQGLAADLAGAAQLDFAPDGLVCRITAPIEVTPVLELTA